MACGNRRVRRKPFSGIVLAFLWRANRFEWRSVRSFKDVSAVKLALPYLKKIATYERVPPAGLGNILSEMRHRSAQLPCYLEVSDASQQCFLFFRDKQIYSAGRLVKGRFSELSIKEFLVAVTQMSAASAAAYEVNSKILHSLLILFQKKPSLKVLTSMVDLDEVLDKIEEEGKSCIVNATQDSFLAALRYEKGEVTALCHQESHTTPRERTFRDDFLVKIYTLSAETPLSINVYEDLLVRYAADAKMIDDDFRGDITELYLSKPPLITLEFKSREIGHWVMDRPLMNVGRTADNDIHIDNLAVSRLHAVIEKDKGVYYIRDCDSLNGTLLNGQRVGRARLNSGDEIVIGKHTIRFQKQTGMDLPAAGREMPETFDQTVIMTGGKSMAATPPMNARAQREPHPRLVEKTRSGEVVFEIYGDSFSLGKRAQADLELGGMFVAAEHAEIVKENGNFVIRHLNGRRKVSVGGKAVKEKVLKDNDSIQIGKRQFTFQE
jgi:pSer/pThr/pTyr-binding forkhead associated (FHA) protein